VSAAIATPAKRKTPFKSFERYERWICAEGRNRLRWEVIDYQRSSCVNDRLRRGKTADKATRRLDRAIARAPLFHGTVYRGVDFEGQHVWTELLEPQTRKRLRKRPLELVDLGFLSTSLEEDVAKEFAAGNPTLVLTTAEPIPALPLWQLGYAYTYEREMLFPRSCRLRCDKVTEKAVYATLLPPLYAE
jgi:ADP-ribosyltransferase exoenzyme